MQGERRGKRGRRKNGERGLSDADIFLFSFFAPFPPSSKYKRRGTYSKNMHICVCECVCVKRERERESARESG